MPWNPYTGMFETAALPGAGPQKFTGPGMNAAPPPGAMYGGKGGYGSGKATGALSGNFRGGAAVMRGYVDRSLIPQERGREQLAAGARGRYDAALADPSGVTDMYSGIYGKVGAALAAPAMRDFNQSYARTGANAASRFGGGVSSEELRQGYNASDLFTRNLSEQLAQLGGQQVAAGQNYTSQLGQAAGSAADERDKLAQMIMAGYGNIPQKQPKKSFGDYAAGIIGGVASNAKLAIGI